MIYRTPTGLTSCRVDDHFIFLDIDADRYFRVADDLERAFLGLVSGGVCGAPETSRLIQAGILTADEELGSVAPTAPASPARRSVLEVSGTPSPCSFSVVLEIMAIIVATRLQLAMLPMKKILEHMIVVRDERISTPLPSRTPGIEKPIVDAVGIFRRGRLYAPVPTRCLLDSISLVRFLARRGVPAKLFFGVTHTPFSAHCWAQVDDLVLNDSVGNVAAYTPICVV